MKARRAPSPTPPAGTIAGARVREDRRIKRKYADLMDFSYDLANRFMPAVAAYMEVSALNYRMMRDICEQLGLPAPEPLPDISKLVYTFKHSLTKAMVDLPAVDRQADGSSYHLQADGSAVISAAMIADAAVADPLGAWALVDASAMRQQDAAPQAAKHPLIDAGDALVAKAQEAAPPLGIPPSTAVDVSDVFDAAAKERRRALMDDVDSHDTSF